MLTTNTNEKLLNAALRLMLAKGYPATTVDEICSEAGVSKGSFYHFFKTKEELGLATLAHFHRRGEKEMSEGPFTKLTDPLERTFGFLDNIETKSKFLWTDGCLLGNFAIELADTHPTVREEVSRIFDEIAGGMALMFRPIAERAGDKGPTATELAEMFLVVLEGAILMARAHQDPDRIPRAVSRFHHYLEQLIA